MHKSNYDPTYVTVNFAMKAERGVEVQIYFFFDLGDRGVWIFNVRLLPLYPLEKKPSTSCTEKWVDSRAGLEGRRKSNLHWDSDPWPAHPIAHFPTPTELSQPTAMYM